MDKAGAATRIAKLGETLRERAQVSQATLVALRRFSEALTRELRQALETLSAEGVTGGGGGTLTFRWGDDTVIVASVPMSAPPHVDSSAATGLGRKSVVGRIVVFLQLRSDPEATNPIFEIYVSPSGRWVAEGLGLPMLGERSDDDSIALLAINILERLTYGIRRSHSSLENTSVDFVSGTVKAPLGFTRETKKEVGPDPEAPEGGVR